MNARLEVLKPDARVTGLVGRDVVNILFRDKESQG
jgi:hypothetical protein